MDPLAQQIADEIGSYNKAGQPSDRTRHVHALAQRNYDALNARGYWRKPENQSMGHALRAHGFVQDNTQGGFLPQTKQSFAPTRPTPPKTNSLFDGTSPQADANHRINDFSATLSGGNQPAWKASTNMSYADLMGINPPAAQTLPVSQKAPASPPRTQARAQFAQARPRAVAPGGTLAVPPGYSSTSLPGADGKPVPVLRGPDGSYMYQSTDGRDPFALATTPITDDERIYGGLGKRTAFTDMTVATLRGTSQTGFYGSASEGGRRLTEDDPRVRAYVRAHPGTKALSPLVDVYASHKPNPAADIAPGRKVHLIGPAPFASHKVLRPPVRQPSGWSIGHDEGGHNIFFDPAGRQGSKAQFDAAGRDYGTGPQTSSTDNSFGAAAHDVYSKAPTVADVAHAIARPVSNFMSRAGGIQPLAPGQKMTPLQQGVRNIPEDTGAIVGGLVTFLPSVAEMATTGIMADLGSTEAQEAFRQQSQGVVNMLGLGQKDVTWGGAPSPDQKEGPLTKALEGDPKGGAKQVGQEIAEHPLLFVATLAGGKGLLRGGMIRAGTIAREGLLERANGYDAQANTTVDPVRQAQLRQQAVVARTQAAKISARLPKPVAIPSAKRGFEIRSAERLGERPGEANVYHDPLATGAGSSYLEGSPSEIAAAKARRNGTGRPNPPVIPIQPPGTTHQQHSDKPAPTKVGAFSIARGQAMGSSAERPQARSSAIASTASRLGYNPEHATAAAAILDAGAQTFSKDHGITPDEWYDRAISGITDQAPGPASLRQSAADYPTQG